MACVSLVDVLSSRVSGLDFMLFEGVPGSSRPI